MPEEKTEETVPKKKAAPKKKSPARMKDADESTNDKPLVTSQVKMAEAKAAKVKAETGTKASGCPVGCGRFGDLSPDVVAWNRENLGDQAFNELYEGRLDPEKEDEIRIAIEREKRN